MINRLYIDNFKSLVDFQLPDRQHELAKFTCLVGLNGAGKSTVLQALDFLGHLAGGGVADWLKVREWKSGDLSSRFGRRRQRITFNLELDLGFGENVSVRWKGVYNTVNDRCSEEEVLLLDSSSHLKLDSGTLSYCIADDGGGGEERTERLNVAKLAWRGSALSLLKDDAVSHVLRSLKKFASSLTSLDMLSPQSMRKRAKEGADIGYGGESLSAFIHSMSLSRRAELLADLKRFYPHLKQIDTKALRAGWKDLQFTEDYLDENGQPLTSGARHINDGLLRILAVLAEVQRDAGGEDAPKETGCVLFDEIENGINPELVKGLVDHLRDASPQVIVTTHSPLVLNYLPDDLAKESVLLLYRNSRGHTRSVRFFDLPSAKVRADLLGPGEVFVDVDLPKLAKEAEALETETAA